MQQVDFPSTPPLKSTKQRNTPVKYAGTTEIHLPNQTYPSSEVKKTMLLSDVDSRNSHNNSDRSLGKPTGGFLTKLASRFLQLSHSLSFVRGLVISNKSAEFHAFPQ